jgi:hypothetical protein
MGFVSLYSIPLLQAPPDTIIARMVSDRGVLDWTNGILQFVVLLLGVATLATMVWLLITVRRGVTQLNGILVDFADESRPLIAAATAVVTDAREVVAMLRTDAERVTDAASEISDRLLDAADTTARRVDDVNAVLDVLQVELEDTAIATVAAVRGVRVGARALNKRPRRKPHDESDA